MNTDHLWQLIDQARAEADGAEPEEIAETAAELLAERSAEEIRAAQQALSQLMAASYTRDLWGAAYLINGGASDDGFEYFRGWLLAQGRTTFEAALANPDSLAAHPTVVAAAEDQEELECEDMLGIAWNAYQSSTGQQLPQDIEAATYPDLGPDWDFDDEDEVRQRLPQLAGLYL